MKNMMNHVKEDVHKAEAGVKKFGNQVRDKANEVKGEVKGRMDQAKTDQKIHNAMK